jgi:phospholipid-binding lipoprotein MlaA
MHARLRMVPLAAAFALVAVAGCAKAPPASDQEAVAEYNETNDPLEPTNRVFYAINDGVDVVVLRPLALAYRYLVPQPVRDHTHNVLANLGEPVALGNDMLQGKPRRAGDSLMRFLVNTTVGVLGIFDVATGWGWPAHDSDPGITFAIWGVPPGPYLYLPVLGPSNPRDAVGFGVGYAMDPFTWIGQGTVVDDLGHARLGFSALDQRERVLDELDRIKAEALDPYATIRSLARQHRQSQIDDVRSDTRATVPNWYRSSSPSSPTP